MRRPPERSVRPEKPPVIDLTKEPAPPSADEVSFDHLWHPYANIFPLIEGPAFDVLVEDIKAHGLNYQIMMFQDKVLDGRNRYLACIKAGINPEDPDLIDYFEGTENDALDYVVSANLNRRHLSESQRGMVHARVATFRPGRQPKTNTAIAVFKSQANVAKSLSISVDTGQRARQVLESGVPELVKRVDAGELSVNVASQIAQLPRERQEKVAKLPVAELRGVVKRERRKERMEELVEATEAASKEAGDQLFNVVYADPPWKFEVYSEITGMDRAADNHYPTMGTDEICELPVPAAADAVLFLWATVPMLPQALEVLRAWGFDYKSNYVWVKDRIGTGYWGRNQHELLLIGTKGRMPAPAPGEQPSSVIQAPVGKHSAKPDEVASIIAGMFPDAAKVEMFARKKRDGWKSIGNEVNRSN